MGALPFRGPLGAGVQRAAPPPLLAAWAPGGTARGRSRVPGPVLRGRSATVWQVVGVRRAHGAGARPGSGISAWWQGTCAQRPRSAPERAAACPPGRGPWTDRGDRHLPPGLPASGTGRNNLFKLPGLAWAPSLVTPLEGRPRGGRVRAKARQDTGRPGGGSPGGGGHLQAGEGAQLSLCRPWGRGATFRRNMQGSRRFQPRMRAQRGSLLLGHLCGRRSPGQGQALPLPGPPSPTGLPGRCRSPASCPSAEMSSSQQQPWRWGPLRPPQLRTVNGARAHLGPRRWRLEGRGLWGWRRPEDGPQSPPARRGSPGSQTGLYIVYAGAPEAPRHLPRDS